MSQEGHVPLDEFLVDGKYPFVWGEELFEVIHDGPGFIDLHLVDVALSKLHEFLWLHSSELLGRAEQVQDEAGGLGHEGVGIERDVALMFRVYARVHYPNVGHCLVLDLSEHR